VAGSCIYGNEPSGSIKCRGNIRFSKRILHHGVVLVVVIVVVVVVVVVVMVVIVVVV
jgi:hypothetical protein